MFRSVLSLAFACALLSACGGSNALNDGGVVVVDGGSAADAGAPYMPAGYTPVAFRSEAPRRSFTAAEQVLQVGMRYVGVLETDVGRIVLDLYEQEAPTSVNSFVFLALHRFYEGVAFHRVIDDFMAQTGDPNTAPGGSGTWGTGGPGYAFGLEVVAALNYDGPGVLGMARANSPNSNGSQFFITFKAQPSLNQQYTIWGRVLEGLDVLPLIARGQPPGTPTRIQRVHIGQKAR